MKKIIILIITLLTFASVSCEDSLFDEHDELIINVMKHNSANVLSSPTSSFNIKVLLMDSPIMGDYTCGSEIICQEFIIGSDYYIKNLPYGRYIITAYSESYNIWTVQYTYICEREFIYDGGRVEIDLILK